MINFLKISSVLFVIIMTIINIFHNQKTLRKPIKNILLAISLNILWALSLLIMLYLFEIIGKWSFLFWSLFSTYIIIVSLLVFNKLFKETHRNF